MNLYKLKKNDSFSIVKITRSGEIGKRIAEMGVTKGTSGIVVRKAFLGGPIQIKILNYDLSLRKDEAESIDVEEV